MLGGGGVWKGERLILQLHGLKLFCVSYSITNLGYLWCKLVVLKPLVFAILFTCFKTATNAHVFYMLFNENATGQIGSNGKLLFSKI